MRRLAVLLGWLIVGLSVVHAADLEDALATYQSGDFVQAILALRPLAEHGDARAQAALYRIYRYGKGTEIDFPEALKWARDAATLGNADGEYGVATAYAFGLGVGRDPALGLRWLEKAADDGSREAQAWLAGRYLYGDGVPPNATAGIRYLTAAADQGLARALMALAQISQDGAFGQPKDPLAALSFQKRAAELRFFPAQIYLAMNLDDHTPVQAATWAILATTTGCNVGRTVALLPPGLSPEDLEKATALSEEWDRSHPQVDLDQFDQTINICNLNRQRAPGPIAEEPSEERPEVDTTGKGAVMCIWSIYTSVEATVDACGLPTTPADDAIRGGLERISKFIIENSHQPVTEEQLESWSARIKNQQIMTVVQPIGRKACGGEDIAPFRTGSPDQIEQSIDDLLSIPREPLMNPCL
ncbi:MAG: tetratricopeptide repeat protein [Devosia sp.]